MILRIGVYAVCYIQVVIDSYRSVGRLAVEDLEENVNVLCEPTSVRAFHSSCSDQGQQTFQMNFFQPPLFPSRRPRKGTVSHACLRVQTRVNSARRTSPELRDAYIWASRTLTITLTISLNVKKTYFDYQDGSPRGNAAQAIGGTVIAPRKNL